MADTSPLRPHVGGTVRISAEFYNAAGVLTDPTTVTFYAKGPSFTNEESFVFGVDAEVVKDATGQYHADFTFTGAGAHWFRTKGTGTVATAEEVRVKVRPSAFDAP